MPGSKDKINIISPNGTILQGTREELKRLQLLGDYKEEGSDALLDRRGEAQTEANYSGALDKVSTFGKGVYSGATLGVLDSVTTDDEDRLKAKYNPKTRLAGEIFGGVGASVASGGTGAVGRLASIAPAGLLTRGATAAGKAVGGLKGAGIAGAIEGAGAGLQAELSNATLTNTPLNAQSLISGIGVGTILGGGLNAGIHGVGRLSERIGTKLEPKVAATEYVPKVKSLGTVDTLEDIHAPVSKGVDEIEIVGQENYDVFRQNIADTKPSREFVDDYVNAIDSDMVKMKLDHTSALKNTDDTISQLTKDAKAAESEIAAAEAEFETYIKKRGKLSEKAVDVTAKDKAAGGLLAPFQELDKSYGKIRDKVSTLIDGNPELNELSKFVTEHKNDFQKALKEGNYRAARESLELYEKGAQMFRAKAATVPGAPKLDHIKLPKLQKNIREPVVADLTADYEAKIAAAKSKSERLTRDLAENQSMRTIIREPDFVQHLAAKEDFGKIGAALDDVKNFPLTAREFQGMGTAKINRLADSLDIILKSASKIDKLGPVVASLENATKSLVESTGIKAEGGLIEQLRAIQKVAKEANKQSVAGPIRHTVIGQKNVSHDILGPIEHEVLNTKIGRRGVGGGGVGIVGDYSAATAASIATKAVGMSGSLPVYMGVKHMLLNGVEGLAGVKSAVQSKISKAAKGMGKAFQSNRKNYVVPKLAPLYTKLNGERDKDARSAREAARNRINELVSMGPVINDVVYRGLEPLAGSVHNDTIAGIFDSMVAGYQALIEMLPKDKHGTHVGFRNVWEPNDIEVALTSKILDAYYSPVGTIEEALGGFYDTIKINTLKKVYPDLYEHMRGLVFEQISETPALYNTYEKQAALSNLLGIPVSSAFSPNNIMEAQSIHFNTPKVANPNSEGGGKRGNSGGGAPPKQEPATAGQMALLSN